MFHDWYLKSIVICKSLKPLTYGSAVVSAAIGAVTARYDVAATVEVVIHDTPNFYQLAMTVIDEPGHRVASARTPKISVTETRTSIAVSAVTRVSAIVTLIPTKTVPAIRLSVGTVMARADMNADFGLERIRLEGRRYEQGYSKQAGAHRKVLDGNCHDRIPGRFLQPAGHCAVGRLNGS